MDAPSKPIDRVTQGIDRLSQAAAQLTFWLMLGLVLVATFNTVARYLGRSTGRDLSSNAFIELQWYLFGAIFLLSGAYTLQRNAHVRVDVLYDRLGFKARGWIDLVGHAVLLIPFAVFAMWTSIAPVQESWRILETSADPGGLPRYPIKSLIPLAFLLLFLQGLSQLIKQAQALRRGEPQPSGAAPGEVAEPQPSGAAPGEVVEPQPSETDEPSTEEGPA